MVFYTLSKIFIGIPLRLLFRVRVKGRLPPKGAYLVASNHESFLDHFIFPGVVKRRLTYMAKAELFESFFGNFFLTNWGQIPVHRGKGDKDVFKAALKVLKDGHLLGIYPEGTRSPDGTLWRGHTGVARLAMMTGRPVIPVGMIGTYEAYPKGRKIPNFVRVTVKIGRPMDFSLYKGMENDREIARKITDSVMFAIADLTNEEYDPDKGYMDPKVMPGQVGVMKND